jgi:drug/metabolite transporter (DMT)-like permease
MTTVKVFQPRPCLLRKAAFSMLSKSSTQVRGVLAMTAATALLVLNDAIAKQLSEIYPVGQILFWRQAIGAVVLFAVLAMRRELHELRVIDHRGQLVRGVLFVANTFLIVYALSVLPLPVVSVILFSSPIIIAALSGPLLGETITPRRWAAILIGFAGVVVIVRPGGTAFTWLMLLPLAPAITSAVRDIATRRLTRTETSISILFWSNALILPAGLATYLTGSAWQPVTSLVAAWLALNALLNLSAHFLMIHALRIADASLVAPFKYTGLIWAFLLGFAIWGYLPDPWTIAGTALIVVSGLTALERQPPKPVAATHNGRG